MEWTLATIMPFGISVLTGIHMYLVGNLWKYSWLYGIVMQGIWLIWVFVSKQYGFLPLNVALIIIYTRNHMRWMKQEMRGN